MMTKVEVAMRCLPRLVAIERKRMRRSIVGLLGVGLGLNVLGLVLSDRWTVAVDGAYLVPVIGLSILLALAGASGRRWAVYVLLVMTLAGAVAQAATFEPRRFVVSALWFGAVVAFVVYLARTRTTGQTTLPRS